jgi:hypothetical protein
MQLLARVKQVVTQKFIKYINLKNKGIPEIYKCNPRFNYLPHILPGLQNQHQPSQKFYFHFIIHSVELISAKTTLSFTSHFSSTLSAPENQGVEHVINSPVMQLS